MLFLSVNFPTLLLLAAPKHRGFSYHFDWTAQPLLALIAGILILIRPKLLNFIVAVYLILVGAIGLLHLSL